MSLNTTLSVLDALIKIVDSAGSTGIMPKLQTALQYNPGSETMVNIQECLSGGDLSDDIRHSSIADISSLSHAPLVCADVERSFSSHKLLLPDRRHSLTPENGKFHFITMCNNIEVKPDTAIE